MNLLVKFMVCQRSAAYSDPRIVQALKDQIIVTPSSIVKAVCTTGSSAPRHEPPARSLTHIAYNPKSYSNAIPPPATPDYLLSKKIFESIKEQAEKDGIAGKSLFGKVLELQDERLFCISQLFPTCINLIEDSPNCCKANCVQMLLALGVFGQNNSFLASSPMLGRFEQQPAAFNPITLCLAV